MLSGHVVSHLKSIIYQYKIPILFFLFFFTCIFLRFYQIDTRNLFGWDQVDNAWAAKNIIVNNEYPLVGMQAKLNSGIYIGPLYYYLVSIVYFFTNLNPSASGIIAGITSLITFIFVFFIARKLFNSFVAIISILIYTTSSFMINFDRTQWPVDLIPVVSLGIFYCMFNVLNGKVKYLILLAFLIGFSLHVHFTSIFYFFILLLSVPFFPRKKATLKYFFLSIPIFILFLIPNIVFALKGNASNFDNLLNYLSTSYHGFHFVRFMQLSKDAFIEFQSVMEPVFNFKHIDFLRYIYLPLFCILYYSSNRSRKGLSICYLVILWFIVPWIVFSLYKGEISNYYFSLTIPIAIIVLAYLSFRIFIIKGVLPKIILILFWSYFSFVNIFQFFNSSPPRGTNYYTKSVLESIRHKKVIQFSEGDPESYIYYIYTKK